MVIINKIKNSNLDLKFQGKRDNILFLFKRTAQHSDYFEGQRGTFFLFWRTARHILFILEDCAAHSFYFGGQRGTFFFYNNDTAAPFCYFHDKKISLWFTISVPSVCVVGDIKVVFRIQL